MKKLSIAAVMVLVFAALAYGGADAQMMGQGMMGQGMMGGGMMGGGGGMQMSQGGMPAVPGDQAALTRNDRQGAVNMQVTYIGGDAKAQSFEVRMDTHSVDLDQYKVEKISILRDDKGNQVAATQWTNDMGGGHHRSGVLIFPAKAADGKDALASDAKYMELVIKGIAGVQERYFKWDLPLKK